MGTWVRDNSIIFFTLNKEEYDLDVELRKSFYKRKLFKTVRLFSLRDLSSNRRKPGWFCCHRWSLCCCSCCHCCRCPCCLCCCPCCRSCPRRHCCCCPRRHCCCCPRCCLPCCPCCRLPCCPCCCPRPPS